jgi:hypothetical protein
MFKALRRPVPIACVAMLLSLARPCPSQTVDASTIQGKVLVGYQGWFRCAGDGSPRNVWSRWFRNQSTPTAAIQSSASRDWVVDVFPDVSGMDPSSRCAVPNLTINGKQGYVFSSFPKATSETHFRWMREYGIDGALMQRFVGLIPELRGEHDAVLRNAVASAEKNGRVIAVEYDISGGKDDTLFNDLKTDWLYLTKDLKITNSPAYLHEKGKPVVSIWGLGVQGHARTTDTQLAKQIVQWFKTEGHATVMGGVPSGWATLTHDTQKDPRWTEVYKELDIVQPWEVSRYKDINSADAWTESRIAPDIALTRRNHQEYLPVIFPGFSWRNLYPNGTGYSDAPFNQIPRDGGKLLWRQAMDFKAAGATMVKIAMFDEVNEGTAILKAAPSKNDTPTEAPFVAMDADGTPLPSDWYLQIAGEIARVYHGNAPVTMTLPIQPPKAAAR